MRENNMKKVIRWSGVFALLVVLIVLTSTLYWVAPWAIKKGIEDYASPLWGAKIDVAEVAVSFSPLGLKLSDIAITDKANPMQNLLVLGQVSTSVNLRKMLLGQAVFEQVAITDVALSVPRAHSGRLPDVEKPERDSEQEEPGSEGGFNFSASGLLPDMGELLNDQSLITQQRIDDWKSWSALEQDRLKQMRANVPDSDRLASYEARWQQIKKGKITSVKDYQQRRDKLKALQEDIKTDKQALSAALKAHKQSLKLAEDKLQDIKQAPDLDLARLEGVLGMESGSIKQMSKSLFQQQLSQFLALFDRSAQELDGLAAVAVVAEDEAVFSEGRFVHFDTTLSESTLIRSAERETSFLIRRIDLGGRLKTASAAEGENTQPTTLEGEIRGVTHQQAITGEPIRYQLKIDHYPKVASLALRGEVNALNPEAIRSTLNLEINDARIDDLKLGGGVRLASSALNGSAHLIYSGAEFQAQGQGQWSDSEFVSRSSRLQQMLENIKQFDMAFTAKGRGDDLDVDFQSDLDQQLKSAVSGQWRQEKARYRQKLQAALSEKVAENDSSGALMLAELGQQSGLLGDNEQRLRDMQQYKLDEFKSEKKAQLKKKEDELKNKLNDKLKGLF
jgi:uncharacterized protein (TIGR03545 family)